MRKTWWLLTVGLTACGQQVSIAPDVALKHANDAGFQQQAQRLQAEQVKVAATAPGATGPGILTLEVINPRAVPGQPDDTLKLRLTKLARLLVADLASPARYQAVSVQATFRRTLFSPRNNSSSQTFIYPLASLR